MKRFIFFVLAMVWCVLPLMADMPKPVGHENVKIGGGFSDSVDSGIDLTHDGIIRAAEILIDVDKLLHIGGYQLTDDDADSGNFEIQDSDNNILFSIADGGTVGNALVTGTLNVDEAVTLDSNLAVNGTALTSSAATFNLLNVTPSVINFGSNASIIMGGDGVLVGIGATHLRKGIFAIFGDATTGSPQLRLYNAADEDGVVDIWYIIAEGTQLELGPNTDLNAFIFGQLGTFTAVGDGVFNGGDLTVGSAAVANIGTTTNPNQLQFIDATNTTIEGNILVTAGRIVAGADSTAQGILTLWDGGGGNTPGHIKIASPNGTVWYVFVEDDGTVKVHNASPTVNADGSEIGSQS